MVKFNFDNIEHNEIFNPFNESWDSIEINIARSGESCFINRKEAKNYFIKQIKLSNNPKVNIYCEWGFYQSSTTGKFLPRPTFYKKNQSGELTDSKTQKVQIKLDNSEIAIKFWEMINFIYGYKNLIDTGEFDRNYCVQSKEIFIKEFKTYEEKERFETLKEIADSTNLSYINIKKILDGTKHKSLDVFYKLLNENDYTEQYKKENSLKQRGQEAAWQHFFSENDWIFAGISLKLLFAQDLLSSPDIGIKDTNSSNSPQSDFLAINDYTSLIEIKTPNTKIFTERKLNTSRADTWSFSQDFIDGISQCLSQKTNWEKNSSSKNILNSNEEILNQNTYRTQDPKVIFIIGNKNTEIPLNSSNQDIIIKRDTFERFRRNNNNIEIITFDELFERAEFILKDIKVDTGKNLSDLPF